MRYIVDYADMASIFKRSQFSVLPAAYKIRIYAESAPVHDTTNK